MQNRRHFTRIIFSTTAHLSDMGKVWTTELIDLSLKGALVKKPDNWKSGDAKSVLLTFKLAQSEIELNMNTSVVHEKEEYLGLLCEQIDIDSATHLKRLIELNVGDDELLNRELDALAHPE